MRPKVTVAITKKQLREWRTGHYAANPSQIKEAIECIDRLNALIVSMGGIEHAEKMQKLNAIQAEVGTAHIVMMEKLGTGPSRHPVSDVSVANFRADWLFKNRLMEGSGNDIY